MTGFPVARDSDVPIYLDNAATSFPKPDAVYAAVDTYLRTNGASIGRGAHAAVAEASQMVEQCRQRIATLIDAESADRIAFTFNCTDGLNLLLYGFLDEGDRVVTTELEHNSVLRPLAQLKKERRLDVEYIPFNAKTGMVDPQDVIDQLRASATRLVVLNHASNVTGLVQPVQEIASAARELGCAVLLDAAQTAGHIPFSVRTLGVDFLATAGHKGLLGPLGTGAVYIREGCEGLIRPVRSGGTGTESESAVQPDVMPVKFESGNMNGPGLAGLNAALEWLNDTGINHLRTQADEQIVLLTSALKNIRGVKVCCESAADTERVSQTGIVSFTVQDYDSREIAGILEGSFGIRCRSGLHCAPLVHQRLQTMENGGTIRFSVGPFTTPAELEFVADAVARIALMM